MKTIVVHLSLIIMTVLCLTLAANNIKQDQLIEMSTETNERLIRLVQEADNTNLKCIMALDNCVDVAEKTYQCNKDRP